MEYGVGGKAGNNVLGFSFSRVAILGNLGPKLDYIVDATLSSSVEKKSEPTGAVKTVARKKSACYRAPSSRRSRRQLATSCRQPIHPVPT